MQGLGRPPLPREHGAWAMLLTPPLAAMLVAGPEPLGLAAALGWFAAYSLRGPVEVLAGHGASGRAGMAQAEKPVARRWLTLFALSAILLLGPVVWLRPGALLLLLSAAMLLGGVYWLAEHGERRSLLAGGLAVVGLMAGAPLYWIAAQGSVPAEGWAVTYACLAFFGGSLFRVKALARERRSAHFRWLSVLVHLLFALGAAGAGMVGWATPWLTLALLPPLLWAVHGAVQASHGTAANLGRVGMAEVWLTLLFALLLIIPLRIPPGM